MVSTWWYGVGISGTSSFLIALGQYRAFTPLNIEKVEIWSGITDTDPLLTHKLFKATVVTLNMTIGWLFGCTYM